MKNIDNWKDELRAVAREEKVKILSSFFKTGKGEYGEGDRFIGIPVPDNRKVSKQYHSQPFDQIKIMLSDPIHEFRLAGLLALVEAYRRAKGDRHKCCEIYEFYLAHTSCCNNWDLVDLSAPYIIGEQMMLTEDDSIVRQLVTSRNLWEQRIAIVATLAQVRKGKLDTAIYLAEQLIGTRIELLQKATGWVLREIGKKDKSRLCALLDQHAATMPRTMLRYAIERFPHDERQHYMTMRKHH